MDAAQTNGDRVKIWMLQRVDLCQFRRGGILHLAPIDFDEATMCLILFAWQTQIKLPLLVLANRDEYFDRPTLPLHRWENTAIYGGKDLSAGGTWLGVHETGRWSALTNFRRAGSVNANAPSRGHLTEQYLTGDLSPDAYLASIHSNAKQYNGFSLLTGTRDQLFYYSNQEGIIHTLSPGVYGLSNSSLNSEWIKVQHGKNELEKRLNQAASENDFFTLMQDRTLAELDKLPNTGIGTKMEEMLSSKFIYIPNAHYGTRTTTLVKFTDERAEMVECTYENGEPKGSLIRMEWEFN